MWQNPLVLGGLAAVIVYLYLIYQRSQLPEEQREDIALFKPLIAGAVIFLLAQYYFSQQHSSDGDSEIVSELIDLRNDNFSFETGKENYYDMYIDQW
jgi:hypothetical protein